MPTKARPISHLLASMLEHIPQGTYVDVQPDYHKDSLVSGLYEAGWRGINIAPCTPHGKNIKTARPKDTHLQLALGAKSGETRLENLLRTLRAENLVDSEATLGKAGKQKVPIRRLDELLKQHGVKKAHLLRIGVGSWARTVALSLKGAQCRPCLVLVQPGDNGVAPDWKKPLLDAGYNLHDGGNWQLYVSSEYSDAPLLASLASEPGTTREGGVKNQQANRTPPKPSANIQARKDAGEGDENPAHGSASITRLEETIQKKLSEIELLTQRVSELEHILTAKDEHIVWLQNDAQVKFHELNDTNTSQLSQLQDIINRKNDHIVWLQGDMQVKINEITADCDSWQKVSHDKQQELEQIYSGLSWQITRPIRTVQRGIGWLRRFPGQIWSTGCNACIRMIYAVLGWLIDFIIRSPSCHAKLRSLANACNLTPRSTTARPQPTAGHDDFQPPSENPIYDEHEQDTEGQSLDIQRTYKALQLARHQHRGEQYAYRT